MTVDRFLDLPIFKWFANKGYLQGVFWINMVALTSTLNDILMRLAGSCLPSIEITFFRYFFAVLTLIPFMFLSGSAAFRTDRPLLHVIRSLLLFGAMVCWSKAVVLVPLAVVSTIALTIPLFVLPLAAIFLKERVGWQRTLGTLGGLLGILVVVISHHKNEGIFTLASFLNNGVIYLLIAAIFFAVSDIINKKYVQKESSLSMLFYIALGTASIAAYPASQVWVTPGSFELLILACLGGGGNLILFFLLRAFAATDVSALAPYRYTELIFATLLGFLLFQELPIPVFWLGSLIIVCSTAAITYYEINTRSKKA